MELTEKIQGLLEGFFQEEEALNDCFVIEVLHNRQLLEVFLDSESGIDLGKCQHVSRFLEGHLDENGWLGEKYRLEVSSPDLSRPLRVPRQFKKNIGKTVKAHFDDEIIEGELVLASDTTFGIEQRRIEREGKKKIEVIEVLEYPYEAAAKVLVQPAMKKQKKKK